MATFKPIVRSNYQKQDGTYRVYIRITHRRVHRDRPTPFYITKDQFTKTGKIKDQRVLDAIEDKIREYRNAVTKIGFMVEGLDIDHFIALIENQSDKIDFFDFWKKQADAIRLEGREGTAFQYMCVLRSLKAFNNNRALYLSDITSDYVLRYYNSISNKRPNTIVSYIGIFKTIYLRAQKLYNNAETGTIVARYGVFDLIDLPRKEYSKDNAFKKVEEMQAVIDVPYKGVWSYDFAKDMFILSFVCFGTNLADWMVMDKHAVKNGILTYCRKKTSRRSGDSVKIQIKLSDIALEILKKYSGDSKFLINTGTYSRSCNNIDQYIHYTFQKAGLEEKTSADDIGRFKSKYTFYANRHTMASFARNICGVEYMTVHEMLNHATPSQFKTTDAYLWKDFNPLWEANDKLLSLFNWDTYREQLNASYCKH